MIGIVGINYKSAPVNIREQFVINNKEEIEDFLKALKNSVDIKEVVVLSTCNRTEIYFSLPKACINGYFDSLINQLCIYKNITINIKPYFYSFEGVKAIKHLFEVAAGLNSMVLGENQIISQVKEAYKISASCNFTNTMMNRAFHKAFEAGKRVRAETAINKGASSLSYVAVELALKLFKDLRSRTVLLVGIGETGELVLQSLTKRGCKHIFITNRTYNKAEELSRKYNAKPVKYVNFKEQLNKYDIIITSTLSKTKILQYNLIRNIIKKRDNKNLCLIDLSIPRVIEKEVNEIDNVYLYNIDDLEKVVADNYEKRHGEIEKANKIIDEIVDDFSSWLQSLSLRPTINLLNVKFESMMGKELNNLKNKITKNEYEKVAEFANFLNRSYIGLIIKNLKILSKNGSKFEYINLVNNLFELQGD